VRVAPKDDDTETTLRPLRKASGAADLLRGGEADPQARRAATVQLTGAAEATLRRMLRDDPHTPVEVRLKALAPDELPADALVAELRRRDRISIELAAAFHELMGRARRLREGGLPEPGDAELALRLTERLEWEAEAPPPPPVPAPEEPVFAEEDALVHPVPPVSRAPTSALPWALGAVALILAAALGWIFLGRGAGDDALEQGTALMRAGQTEAAVPHLLGASREDPEDPRPRLLLARIYRQSGRMDAARTELRRALEAAPEDPALHRELGFLLLDAGRPELAVPSLRQAVQLDRRSVAGWVGLVRALRAAGQPAAAEQILSSPDTPREVRAYVDGPGASAQTAPFPL
jgi:tetratricopeptide (TPR) repeat protein